MRGLAVALLRHLAVALVFFAACAAQLRTSRVIGEDCTTRRDITSSPCTKNATLSSDVGAELRICESLSGAACSRYSGMVYAAGRSLHAAISRHSRVPFDSRNLQETRTRCRSNHYRG